MSVSLNRVLRVSSLPGATMVVAMLAIFATTGVGQDPLQFVHPADEYTRILLKNPAALRATIGLDNFFIAFYSTAFVALGVLLLRRAAQREIVFVAMGLLLLLGFLDMIENFHFLVMLAGAEQHLPPSETEIRMQVFESLLKFHVGYLGVLLLGVALPRSTRLERALSNLSLFVQLPVGILIYVTPREVSIPLVFVRLAYFISALILLALAFGDDHDAGDGVGSGSPA